MPRVSVNVGYFRNWWGNWYAVDNRATDGGATTRRSVSRRHSIRGSRAAAATSISGLYNLVPGKVGQVDELAQHATNFGDADRELAGRRRQRRARGCGTASQSRAGTSTGRQARRRLRA